MHPPVSFFPDPSFTPKVFFSPPFFFIILSVRVYGLLKCFVYLDAKKSTQREQNGEERGKQITLLPKELLKGRQSWQTRKGEGGDRKCGFFCVSQKPAFS